MSPHAFVFLTLLEVHKENLPVAVRLSYILGNITFSEVSSRIELFKQNVIPIVINLLHEYYMDERFIQGNEMDDIVTKVVRLAANLAMHDLSGREMCYFGKTTVLILILRTIIMS